MKPAAAALLAVALAGCSIFTDSFEIDGFSGDPFPIDVDTTTGAIVVGISTNSTAERVAVMDLLSPFTIIDTGSNTVPVIAYTGDGYPYVTIFGEDGPGGPLTLPRAQLAEPQLISLHPCNTDPCTVGPAGSAIAYSGIVGADSLAGDDVRLDLAESQISILENLAGGEQALSTACDAVFPSPYRGGGTAIVNGTELDYGGRRVTVAACVAFDPSVDLLQSARGMDALFVVSTAIGTSILGQAAYERYRLFEGNTPPDIGALPTATVMLPSGPITGQVATLPSMALVGYDQSTNRGPCREDYAHHLLLARNCTATDDCPCKDTGVDNGDDTTCSVPAIVELTPPAGFPILVVPDDDPTLQALRTELAPDQADLDGILGTSALQALELDADFPHDRVVMRCAPGAASDGCVTRPELPTENPVTRTQVTQCIGSGAGSGSGILP